MAVEVSVALTCFLTNFVPKESSFVKTSNRVLYSGAKSSRGVFTFPDQLRSFEASHIPDPDRTMLPGSRRYPVGALTHRLASWSPRPTCPPTAQEYGPARTQVSGCGAGRRHSAGSVGGEMSIVKRKAIDIDFTLVAQTSLYYKVAPPNSMKEPTFVKQRSLCNNRIARSRFNPCFFFILCPIFVFFVFSETTRKPKCVFFHNLEKYIFCVKKYTTIYQLYVAYLFERMLNSIFNF